MPFDDPLFAVAPLAGLAALTVAHLFSSRVLRLANPYHSLSFGAVCGLGMTGAVSWAPVATFHVDAGDAAALVVLNIVAYLSFAYGYFGFVNLNLTSLRIRILAEILESGGELDLAQLTARYGMEHVAAIRLGRLTAGGYLIERCGRIYNGKWNLLAFAKAVRVMQICVLGRKSLPVND
jgi:hypothetical protein